MPAKKVYVLSRSTRPGKKYMVRRESGSTGRSRTIHFGAAGMSDFTKHRDPERKEAYIRRHRARESWGASGSDTAGFWSRWLLWNKPSVGGSVRDIERRFPSIRVTRGRAARK